MKKALALLLTFAMLFSLAACGGNQSEGGNDQPQATEPKYDYVAFMLKYKAASPSDAAALMGEYSNMMSQYVEAMQALEDIDQDELSKEEALYYHDRNPDSSGWPYHLRPDISG